MCILRPEDQVQFGNTLSTLCCSSLRHQPGNEAFWVPKRTCSVILPETDAGLTSSQAHLLAACEDKCNAGLFLVSRALPSHIRHKDKACVYPDRLNRGHQRRQTYFCCTVTPLSYLLPHGYSSEGEALRTTCDLSCLLAHVNVKSLSGETQHSWESPSTLLPTSLQPSPYSAKEFSR